eukprot:scaffold27484_cov120-Isochrysis_galbana.AAC.3
MAHVHGSRKSANVTRHARSARPSPNAPSIVPVSGGPKSSRSPQSAASAQNQPAHVSRPSASANVINVYRNAAASQDLAAVLMADCGLSKA